MADAEYRRLTCAGCASPFSQQIGRGRTAKYCGPSCRPRESQGLRSVEPKHHRTCGVCGAGFVAAVPSAKFCSGPCKNRASNVRTQERARDRTARACRFCGKVFAPAYGDKRKVFCSKACKVSYTYAARGGNTHRRRAKQFGGSYETVDRFKVFDRDGWRCHLCGRKTPRERLGSKHDRAPELDHLVPLSQGGAHAYTNVACACRSCNAAKGATALGQLLLIG